MVLLQQLSIQRSSANTRKSNCQKKLRISNNGDNQPPPSTARARGYALPSFLLPLLLIYHNLHQPVNPAYCLPHQTTLVMREKVWSLSGDTFHIVDSNNHEVLQCRGQAMSLSDRKEFADNAGRPLFSLRTRHFTIHKSFYAEAADGTELFEVKGKFSLGGSKMLATFMNRASSNAAVELRVKGDWFDRTAEIKMGDVVVAQISRKLLNMREIFGGQQTVCSFLSEFILKSKLIGLLVFRYSCTWCRS